MQQEQRILKYRVQSKLIMGYIMVGCKKMMMGTEFEYSCMFFCFFIEAEDPEDHWNKISFGQRVPKLQSQYKEKW